MIYIYTLKSIYKFPLNHRQVLSKIYYFGTNKNKVLTVIGLIEANINANVFYI